MENSEQINLNGINDIEEIHRTEPSYSVDVSIEPSHECEILEIKYDGQEIYKEPLTHSEYLAEMISKINFFSDTQNDKDEKTDNEQASNKVEILNARKFFQILHEKVKLSYDEVCVLLDCLSIARADKLMNFESVIYDRRNEEKPIEVSDKTLSLILKKRNIEKSKNLLKKSIEKINNDLEYYSNRFHQELYRARQIWKIKKIGTKFNCDLSYRSVGCVNSMKVNFELIKNDNPINKENFTKAQYLSVIVPEEFRDCAFIRVEIVKSLKNNTNNSIFDSKFSLFSNENFPNIPNQSWQEVLERTQNSVYCKEIYNQLLREVFDPNYNPDVRPIITGNSIKLMINIEHDLIISLVQNSEKTKSETSNSQKNKKNNYDNAFLEYFLHDLLKRSFEQNFFHFDQRPVTSTFAFNSHVKIAGMAYVNLNNDEENALVNLPNSINHLLNRKKKINILQSIKEKAEHLLIRKKVIKIMSRVCREVCEPHIFIEPSLWNNSTSTDIRVTISSYYYENLAKLSFYVIIKQAQVFVLNRLNSLTIPFTESIDHLENYLIDQCCFHQINLIVSFCELFGWIVLGNSFSNTQNSFSMYGTGLVYNEDFKKKIAIKVSTVNKIELYVFQYSEDLESLAKNSNSNTDSQVTYLNSSNEWINIKDTFEFVDINEYPGLTQIQKFELFLAEFSTINVVDIKKNRKSNTSNGSIDKTIL